MAKTTGVTQLTGEQIEEKAEEVLEFFDPTLLANPRLTGIVSILAETNHRFGVEFAIRELGCTPCGLNVSEPSSSSRARSSSTRAS